MFRTRLISGIVIVLLTLGLMMKGGIVLAAALCVISLIAMYEFYRATGVTTQEPKKINAFEVVGLIGVVVYYAILVSPVNELYLLLTLITLLITLMFVYVFTFPKYHARQLMAAFYGIVYAPVLMSFIYLTRMLPHGEYIVWLIFISSWMNDTCAYCVGVLIGKHKLAPKLSPHKSVEGSIGGVVGAAIVAGLFAFFLVEKVMQEQAIVPVFVLIGAVGAIVAQIGDLAASAIKRNYEIKDYGKIIPGHGGILDRFDSVIFTAPMIYFLAIIMVQL
ncbi:MAG TPA: phosphatidate cytidylyltransferase [Lachnospiraceae bacterium]|jgi:phosphatidate cytidylyltransferase|nr:phosphatidate cytidylyltransferase [Lachnospiraceae bacterium]